MSRESTFAWEDQADGFGVTRSFICQKCGHVFSRISRPLYLHEPVGWSKEARDNLTTAFKTHLQNRCWYFQSIADEEKEEMDFLAMLEEKSKMRYVKVRNGQKTNKQRNEEISGKGIEAAQE